MIKSKDLYGCFNIFRYHVLTNTIGRFKNHSEEDGGLHDQLYWRMGRKTYNCQDKFRNMPKRNMGVHEIDDILSN